MTWFQLAVVWSTIRRRGAERSLQVTYRKGQPFAAYLQLSLAIGEKSARTVATQTGCWWSTTTAPAKPSIGRFSVLAIVVVNATGVPTRPAARPVTDAKTLARTASSPTSNGVTHRQGKSSQFLKRRDGDYAANALVHHPFFSTWQS